jgi:glycine/sarcosine N-methyltransferase
MYGKLTQKYDTWSSWDTRLDKEIKFFKKLFKENNVKTVLDCACGTGIHVIALNKAGFDVAGSDIDQEMIRQAKQNAQSQEISANFKVSDFRILSETYNKTFDAILCVGNSLSHILTDEDLQKSLNQIYKVLTENGVLILHLRNYQKMLKDKQRFFAYKKNDEIFFYVWDFEPKYVVNVVNFDLKNNKTESFSFDYNPIVKSKLTKHLKKSGFRGLQFFGDNKFTKYDLQKDNDLIVVCKK